MHDRDPALIHLTYLLYLQMLLQNVQEDLLLKPELYIKFAQVLPKIRLSLAVQRLSYGT